MPRSEVREIMDELTNLGGMTPAHMVLITELVAVCLSAAGPKPRDDEASHCVTDASPLSGAERTKRWRQRKNSIQACDGNVTIDAIDNNNINFFSGKGGVGGKPKVTQGSRLPEDWNPSECLWSWGKEKLSEPVLRFETAAFKDFWHAKPGASGKKLDWDKTWKNWVREAVRRRERFKPKEATSFTETAKILTLPKKTWAEIKAEKEAKQ